MSLESEINELQQQRDAELGNLKWTASRTRRTLTRALSPDRQIRKHLGLVMGAAALGGYLLAPATPKGGRKKKPAKPGGFSTTLLETLNHYFPQLQQHLPFLKKKPVDSYEADDLHHDPTAPVESAHQAVAEDYGREPDDARPFSAPHFADDTPVTSDPAAYEGYSDADFPAPAARPRPAGDRRNANGHDRPRRSSGLIAGMSDTLKGVVAATLADVAAKIDWQKLADELVHNFTASFKSQANPPSPPSVAVADAGTSPADERIGGRFSTDPRPEDKPKG